MKRLTVCLPDALAEAFLQEVQRQRRPISWVVRDALRSYLLRNDEVAGFPQAQAPATSCGAIATLNRGPDVG